MATRTASGKPGRFRIGRSKNGGQFVPVLSLAVEIPILLADKAGVKPIQIYSGRPWKTDTERASMDHYAMKFSMLSDTHHQTSADRHQCVAQTEQSNPARSLLEHELAHI